MVLRFEGRSLDLGAMCLSMRTGAKYRSRMRNSSCWHCSRAVVAESYRVISCELGSQGATMNPTTEALTCSWRDCGVRLSQMRNLRALSSLYREWVTDLRQQCGKPIWRRHRRSSRSKGERRAAPAELRQLSVLACQIRGLAALSTQLDPEDESELMSSIHRVCADVAARFRGVVARVLGDSLLIYFGYTEAQEHDPERAVRAGLELIGAIRNLDLPSALHPHIGIATGLMMVGASPGPPDEFAATGQALNLALRLQSAAPSDSVLITSHTRELVGDFFNYQEMEPLLLADDLAPVKVWRVTGESNDAGRFEALRRTGMLKLVGRRQEMDLLRRCWSKALTGAGQVVLVTGEPGIGKSRLIAEFEEETNAELYNNLKYFGSPHQTDAAFYAVIGELQRAAGFERADTPSERLAKLTALIKAAGHSATKGLTLIADLLSLPIEDRPAVQQLTPQQRKERTLAALLARIEDLAARQPMLLLVEDAHWLDPTSVEFLTLLVELIPKLPVMMLITARPEFVPPWPVYAHMTWVTLARLNREDAGLLVDRVVGGKPLPQEVMSQILSQTDGVPLFIEELTKTLLESGILCEGPDKYEMTGTYPSQAIPKTLHGSLLARLDRLGSAKDDRTNRRSHRA